MKIKELTPGLQIYVNNEEADFLKKFDDLSDMPKMHLEDRQLLLANQLVNKGLLRRIKKDGGIIYKKRIR
jgi:hypothetical protein